MRRGNNTVTWRIAQGYPNIPCHTACFTLVVYKSPYALTPLPKPQTNHAPTCILVAHILQYIVAYTQCCALTLSPTFSHTSSPCFTLIQGGIDPMTPTHATPPHTLRHTFLPRTVSSLTPKGIVTYPHMDPPITLTYYSSPLPRAHC